MQDGAALNEAIVYTANGEISERRDATGATLADTDPSYSGRYAWTGRERDAQTKQQYNRARYYGADIARWYAQDPSGFSAGDSNLYRYVGNAPTQWADPSGLQPGTPPNPSMGLGIGKFASIGGGPGPGRGPMVEWATLGITEEPGARKKTVDTKNGIVPSYTIRWTLKAKNPVNLNGFIVQRVAMSSRSNQITNRPGAGVPPIFKGVTGPLTAGLKQPHVYYELWRVESGVIKAIAKQDAAAPKSADDFTWVNQDQDVFALDFGAFFGKAGTSRVPVKGFMKVEGEAYYVPWDKALDVPGESWRLGIPGAGAALATFGVGGGPPAIWRMATVGGPGLKHSMTVHVNNWDKPLQNPATKTIEETASVVFPHK